MFQPYSRVCGVKGALRIYLSSSLSFLPHRYSVYPGLDLHREREIQAGQLFSDEP